MGLAIRCYDHARHVFRIIANQAAPDADPPGIRYFAVLEAEKAVATNFVTCCESQGTRTYGALPEFVFSTLAPAGNGARDGDAAGTDSTVFLT